MLGKVTGFFRTVVGTIGNAVSSVGSSIIDFFGFGKPKQYDYDDDDYEKGDDDEPEYDDEYDDDEYDDDEYDDDEYDDDEPDYDDDETDDDDIPLPDNLVIIDGEPIGEDSSSYRGAFYFISDVIEYARDVPIQVRAYVIDREYRIYISADSDDEMTDIAYSRSWSYRKRAWRKRVARW